MFIDYETFRMRADALLHRIAEQCQAAGRKPQEVTLLPVTKTHPAAAAEYAARYGLAAVGENRVQEAVDKRAQTQAAVRWELIGHLQSNKAKLATAHFGRIQSVDSEKLLDVLDRAAGELGRKLPVLRRYPAALAHLARHHARGSAEGARQGYRIARTEADRGTRAVLVGGSMGPTVPCGLDPHGSPVIFSYEAFTKPMESRSRG